MSFPQSFNNQSSSALRINVMVVDDDPVFLQIMSRMLEKSKYRDPSVMEITVIAAKGSMEALSTLKIQRNNIDLIVTDYYMPSMNGLQLKTEITREFGNLPVIVMSSDNNKKQESLTCGAMCFITKPIKANDLTIIYQYALTYKRNGKSIIWSTEQNHKDTDVITVPRQIELLPEQSNDLNIMKKKCSSGPDAKSGNSTNASCVSANGLAKNRKRRSDENSGDDVESVLVPCKKTKVTWTDDLHDLFLQAIRHIGLDKAVPKKILQYMNIPYLTRENVASHLQKYRMFLRRVAERGLMFSRMLSVRGIDSTYPYAHMREPYLNYYTASSSWYDTTLNNRTFSKPRHGLGQSRLLSNAPETTIRRNQMPYNYMNRSSTYEPNRIGSNSKLPMIKSNINFSNQRPSENKGKKSLFEPSLTTINETGQTSQVRGFGKLGPNNGNTYNDNMMNSYGSVTPNETRVKSYGSLTPSQAGVKSYASLTPNQTGLNSYESLTPINQTGVNIYGSLTPNQTGLGSYGSSTPKEQGLNSYESLTPNQQGLSSYGSSTPNQQGLSSYGSSTPKQQGLSSYGSSTPKQQGLSSYESSTPNQQGLNSYGSLTSNQTGLSSYGTLDTNQQGLSSYGSLTPNQPWLSSYGTLTTNQQGLSSYGCLTPNQTGLSSYGSLTLNQQGSSSFGSLTPYQPGSSSCGSLTPNQSGTSSFGSLTNLPGLSSYGSFTPTEPGSSHFSFGMQSFLNNENVAYTLPQPDETETSLPNIEIPQLEKLNLYDDLGYTNELPWEISNIQFSLNKEQGDQTSTNFDLPDFPSELNQIFSVEDDDDWTFVNINQGHTNGDTSNTFAAPEMNAPTFNMNPNHNQVHFNGDTSNTFAAPENAPTFNMNPNQNQEQDVPDFTDWSFLDVEELVDDDFMDSLFVNDMN